MAFAGGRRSTRLLLVLVATFVIVAHVAQADVIQARLDENNADKLIFVSKFCYSTTGVGSLSINTWHVRNDTDLRLLFFDDELWEEVHHRGLTCQQIRDKVDGVGSGQAALREGTNLTFNIAARSRPRYWYAAFSRCAPGPMKFDFELEFLNDGAWWNQQFSVDQQGLLVMFIVYFVVYSVINLCNFAYIYTRPATTRLFKLFALVALLEGTSKFCFLVHYGLYANDGIGLASLASLGEVLSLAVTLGLMGLLVLLSRGWHLTSHKLSRNISANMFIVMTLVYCLYVAAFLWSSLDVDPVSTDVQFERAPGVINLLLRVVIWAFFLVGVCMILLDRDAVAAPMADAPVRERSADVLPDVERDGDEERLLRRSRRNRRREEDEAEAEAEADEDEDEVGAEVGSREESGERSRDAERPQSYDSNQTDRIAAKKRFFTGLAVLGSFWFLSVPLMVALSESFPVYDRLKAVVALLYTVNFIVITLCLLWLYPERDGLHLIQGGGVFLDLSWPTFGARGGEWEEIQSPLLAASSATTPLNSSSATATTTTATATSSINTTTAPPSYTNEAPRSRGQAEQQRATQARGDAQAVYDDL